MTPFRRKGRPYYEIEPTIHGVGKFPRTSTGLKNKRVAESIEQMLHELPLAGYRDLVVRAMGLPGRERQRYLHEMWHAKLAGRHEQLRPRASDPTLAEAVEAARAALAGPARARERAGLDQLLQLAPRVRSEIDPADTDELRLSWLTVPEHVNRLYRMAEAAPLTRTPAATRSANSVRRSLHRAVCWVLRTKLGKGRMLAVMAEVATPGARNERLVLLYPQEIDAALLSADPELQRALGIALTTMIDQGPLLRARARDYDEETGVLVVHDSKTESRQRILSLRDEPVLANAEHWLRLAAAGKRPEDPLIDLAEQALRYRWQNLRDAIGRPDVWWKDLRAVGGTYYLLAGGTPKDLREILGHKSDYMMMRYIRRVGMLGRSKELRAYAPRLGQIRPQLRVEKGRA